MTTKAWIAFVATLLFAGCPRDPVANTSTAGSGTGSAKVAVGSSGAAGSGSAGSGSASDPWAVPKEDGDPPDASTTRALADKACPTIKAPYYYRITKAGKTSYMLGTRHLGVPLSKMPAKVTTQLKKASLVVFETPPGDEGGDGSKKDHKPISEQLGPKLWAKYTALVGERTASSVDHQSPAIALLSLMMLYEDKFSALDNEIQQMVEDAKIKTGGLESSAFQDKLLAELLDIRMLKATVMGTPDRKTLERESAKDLKEYCAGTDEEPGMDERSRKLLKAGGYSDDEIKKMDEKLLDDRNNAWMPQLETAFARGDVFVVVGADHLIGKKGVIKMLSARGFETARVAP